jgi:hypothetical protein
MINLMSNKNNNNNTIQICYPYSLNLYAQTGSETYMKMHSFFCPLLFKTSNDNDNNYNNEVIIHEELFQKSSSLANIKSKTWLIEVVNIYNECLYINNDRHNDVRTVVGKKGTYPLGFTTSTNKNIDNEGDEMEINNGNEINVSSFLSIDVELLESKFDIDSFQELHSLHNIREIVTNVKQDFINYNNNNNNRVELEKVLSNILNSNQVSREVNINNLSISNIKLTNKSTNRVIQIDSDNYLEKIQFKIASIENNHIKTASERRISVKFLLQGKLSLFIYFIYHFI